MAVKIQVVGLDGTSFSLRVQGDSYCGDLLKLISLRLGPKPGAVLRLCFEGTQLKIHEPVNALVGDADFVTVSYVYTSIVQGP